MKKIHNPHKILTLIRNHYSNLYSFSCRFTRTYIETYTMRGEVKFKYPNKAKSYGTDIPLSICDGKNEFYFNPLLKTVWIAPVPEKEDLAGRFARTGIAALAILFSEELTLSTVFEDSKKYRLKFFDINESKDKPLEGFEIEADKTSLRLVSFQTKSFGMTAEKIFEIIKRIGNEEVSLEKIQKVFKGFQEEIYRMNPQLKESFILSIKERYSNWRENIRIEDSEFEFTIPQGVTVKKVERIGCDKICREFFIKEV